MPDTPLMIRLFGPLEVRLRGEPLRRLRTRKVAWTLALLVLRHGRAVEREWLAGTLWPDSTARWAYYNLRRSLSELRRALGPEAWRITTPNRHVVSLDLSGADVDLLCFDDAVRGADAQSLARAAAIYGGPLLEGCTEEWVVSEREAREQAYLQALERLASESLSSGDAASAVGHLRRAVAVDPLRESAQRTLLEALAARGEYGEAVQSYRALRLLLWEELRTEPSPETRAVYERVREQARDSGQREASRVRREGRRSSAPLAAQLPPIWNVPHRRNPNFTGRDDLLAGIEATLAAGGPAALTQAIVGLGGVGKTQCALEYTYRHVEEYRTVWWVRSEEPAQLAADYAALAGPLDLPEKAAASQSAAVDAVRHWLERSDGWLLIFDNAPGPAAVTDYLPRAGSGHVLITSRDQNWGSVAALLAVPVLPRAEAVAFLGRRTGWSGPEVVALAEELGQLPLALEQAAAYAATTGCSAAAYLDLFRTHRQALLQRAKPPEGYHGTVTSTWSLSIAEAAEECPAAADLLSLCAYLAPDHIPLSFVQDGAELCPEPLADAGRDPLVLQDAVAALRRYSLVSVHQDALSVHRLVQAVVRDGLSEDEQAMWSLVAARVVFVGFPRDDSLDRQISMAQYWPECDRRLPHALAAANQALPFVAPDPTGAVCHLFGMCGVYLSLRGRYEEARVCFARSVETAERILGPEDPYVAYHLWDLSTLADDPRPLRERAADILGKAGEGTYGGGLVYVAQALCAEGDDAGAKALCERALPVAERAIHDANVVHAVPEKHATLAYLEVRLGDLAAARAAVKRAAAWAKQHIAPDHLVQGWIPYYHAYLLAQEGDLAGEALEWERALAVWKRILHPGDTRLAMALYPLGMHARLGAGDLQEAKRCLEEALAIAQQAHGAEHPFAGAILCGLAQVWQFLGELAIAKALAEQALMAAPVTREPWDDLDLAYALMGVRPSARRALVQLASVLLDLGDLQAAGVHLDRALLISNEMYAEWTGPDHEGITEVLPTLARLRRSQGRAEESKAYLEQSLAAPEYPGPPHQWRMAATYLEYGLTLQEMGDLVGAREHLAQAIAMFECRLGPRHPRTESARRGLAALDTECRSPSRSDPPGA